MAKNYGEKEAHWQEIIWTAAPLHYGGHGLNHKKIDSFSNLVYFRLNLNLLSII